jgi:hypothetical protein
MQQFLYLFPLAHGQGAFRDTAGFSMASFLLKRMH